MLKSLFSNKLKIKKVYQNLIERINTRESELKLLTDNEIKKKFFNLKNKYQKTKNLNSLIVDSFAITQEASCRSLGLQHFNVQLLGGLVLNEGKIAEMKTGEGKTLVATLPAVLNSLTNKGVHIVTVNDYLANRDLRSMNQIYTFLGLKSGLIQEKMTSRERKKNYLTDITYVTNNELGFDYLRDNTTLNFKQRVLKPFNFCIIDEVDSVLIDEAQTPLILSNKITTSIEKFIVSQELTNYLEVNKHFEIDQKNKNIILKELGIIQIEAILEITDLYNPTDPWIPYIINAIKANTLFFLNVHYIIQNSQIVIVDEFTGRVMINRRWSDGLHQAIEAKENLPIKHSTEVIASITYQNFFLLYPKLSGMTGTAKTAELEFEKIYNLSVIEIPTHKPVKRKDDPDLVYKDQFSKWKAITKECYKVSKIGQPILIGTTTVEKSEMLSELLKESNLSYQILNAKPENIRRESEIIAQAGVKNCITIATNMAGRGTDIILGGNIAFQVKRELYFILTSIKIANRSSQKKTQQLFNILNKSFLIKKLSYKCTSLLLLLSKNKQFALLSDINILRSFIKIEEYKREENVSQQIILVIFTELLKIAKNRTQYENEIIKNLGGLCVIGTERNNSRRIDNQLRGRCGRQGDPGRSKFFLSLDDALFRIFGDPKIRNFMKSQLLDDSPIESKWIEKSLESAQQQVEERTYEQRKYLFEYDDILNKQRNVVYNERREILRNSFIRHKILSYGEQIITDLISRLKKTNRETSKFYIYILLNLFGTKFIISLYPNQIKNKNLNIVKSFLFEEFWLTYELKILEFEQHHISIIQIFQQTLLLSYIDLTWKEHLQKMNLLRDAVSWRSYGQRNPLYEYKEDAYHLFYNLNILIRHLFLYDLIYSYMI